MELDFGKAEFELFQKYLYPINVAISECLQKSVEEETSVTVQAGMQVKNKNFLMRVMEKRFDEMVKCNSPPNSSFEMGVHLAAKNENTGEEYWDVHVSYDITQMNLKN